MLSSSALNPFLLLMDPSAVLRAVESSTSLGNLQARVFRPLEPTASVVVPNDDVSAYDAAIETEAEIEAEIDAVVAEQDFESVEHRL